jgi:hypothetical protein
MGIRAIAGRESDRSRFILCGTVWPALPRLRYAARCDDASDIAAKITGSLRS